MYLNKETMKFPEYIGHVQSVHPEWDESQPLPEPWVEVVVPEPPTVAADQIYFPGEVTENDGTWTLNWNIRDLTEEEILSNKARMIQTKVRAGHPLTQDEADMLVGDTYSKYFGRRQPPFLNR